ncbi:histidine phosphatase superfamily [Rhodocollybia butyracea]|uniref:Histidine phosphatase superfamily n=1 Tax=Rhodocollybia butyracea TaxID=206335 RepID=A0A9P5TZI5_9AGAR|nr:histidine phosphatase superfamily [Rhodocollybia butyracea]
MIVARVYIVRHGETDENRAHIIQGQREYLLNQAGREQAAMAIDAFSKVDLDFALTSDLKRAAEVRSSKLYNRMRYILIRHRDYCKRHPRREKILVKRTESLRERCLGKLEGKHLSERRNYTDDETAESPESFAVRALDWWDTTVKELTEAPGKKPYEVLVVSHGGFISALVKNLISTGRVETEPNQVTNWICFNLSITKIEVEEGSKARLVTYSDISHLKASDLVTYNADVLKEAGLST